MWHFVSLLVSCGYHPESPQQRVELEPPVLPHGSAGWPQCQQPGNMAALSTVYMGDMTVLLLGHLNSPHDPYGNSISFIHTIYLCLVPWFDDHVSVSDVRGRRNLSKADSGSARHHCRRRTVWHRC